jgi:hypothetical protein
LDALKISVVRRVERLEGQIHPSEPELPPIDFDLLIESENAYFSKQMTVLRTQARELGYGDKNNKVSWLDLGSCDPVCSDRVREECLEALNYEGKKVIETLHLVIEKCLRLTANLSDEEKVAVKEYNKVTGFFGNSMLQNHAQKGWIPGHTREELAELRRRYELIMQKHGEPIYE